MLIFLDLETTGVTQADKICSLALVYEKNYHYTLVNEGRKIPADASAIHHITNEMVREKKSLLETKIYTTLEEMNQKETILVMHNAPFCLEMLASCGFIWQGEVIDTLRVTKHLMPECDSFALQNLRYELKLYREELQHKEQYGIKDALYAHHALSDALVVKLLFQTLEELASSVQMVELSRKSVLMQKFSFGKYSGRYIEEISMQDRAYLEWLLCNAKEIDEDMRYSLEYYLQG